MAAVHTLGVQADQQQRALAFLILSKLSIVWEALAAWYQGQYEKEVQTETVANVPVKDSRLVLAACLADVSADSAIAGLDVRAWVKAVANSDLVEALHQMLLMIADVWGHTASL